MPIEYKVGDYGDTVNLKRVQHEEGVIAVLYRNIPAEAKAALEFMAVTATQLQREKQEYCDGYNSEVAAHNETRHMLVAKANAVLQKGIDLLALNQELQEQIAELQGHFPLIVEDLAGG